MRRDARALATAALLATTLVGRPGLAQSPPAAPETISVGDWQLAPMLEVRTRGEYRHDPVDLGGVDPSGTVGPRVRDAWAILERARIGLGVERGALRARVVLQDAHAWGAPVAGGALGTTTRFAQLGAYEAFVELRTASARPSFLRLGRQALTWGDGRLVGGADWAPVGRALDAIRGHVPVGVVDLDAFAAVLDSPAPLGVAAGDTMGPPRAGAELYGAQASWALDPLLRLEATALARVSRGSHLALDASRFSRARDEGETYTASLRGAGEAKGWKYAVEGAYQFGRVAGGSLAPDAVDRSAFAAAAFVSKRIDALLWTPTLRAGASYASGDARGSTYKQFDPILPEVHVWHGAMDAFAWSNLVEAHASVAFVPWIDSMIAVEYRYARLADTRGEWVNGWLGTIGSASGPRNEELGHEIDVGFSWRPWAPLELSSGYSVLVLGDGGRAVLATQARGLAQPDGSYAPADAAHFGYLQVTLSVP